MNPNFLNIPVELNASMISFKVKNRNTIDTQIGLINLHKSFISDFDPDEFINDFTSIINKTINFKLRIDIEYDEIYNFMEIIVNTNKMIDWNYMDKIEKCANVLLKYNGKYKRPPKCLVIESYSPAS